MDKVEHAPARTPDRDRTSPTGARPAGTTSYHDAILALQRGAGNRAVGELFAPMRAAPAGRAATSLLQVQRQPEDEPDDVPEEERVWPVEWPEETEGEQYEDCFDPDTQTDIVTGAMLATSAARSLAAKPPSLESAVGDISAALDMWVPAASVAKGPGVAVLNGASDRARRASSRVATCFAPVATVLEQLATAASDASSAAHAAKSMTTPAPPPAEGESIPEEDAEASRPCFDEGQQAMIADAVHVADRAATELTRRPPDYRSALHGLSSAATALDGIGGEEPGQASLREAVSALNGVIESVDAYLTPVEKIVAEAVVELRGAAAEANRAAVMKQPAPHAPEGAGAPEPAGPGPTSAEEGPPGT